MEAKCLSKAKLVSLDIISTIPETIIETILCLLPIEEAARTSILSRQWRYKWTKIPKLVFYPSTVSNIPTKKNQTYDIDNASKYLDMTCKLLCVVHQVLFLHQGPILEFTLSMFANNRCYELDQILLHLSKNHAVKILALYFDNNYWYKLPSCVFSLHQLTDLDLYCVELDHQPIISGFGSLKNLSLTNVRISTKALLHLLSDCPLLASFTLLTDLGPIGDKDSTIIELFECLPMIEHLTTLGSIVHARLVQDSIPKELPTSLIHLKYFCFEEMCFANDHGLIFLIVLIKCSPNLEKIRLQIDTSHNCCENGTSSAILDEYSDVWLEHLTELEIESFSNLKPEMDFVKFILARSPKLKKMSIFSMVGNDREGFEMLKVLTGGNHFGPRTPVMI